jgi:hypothetical protein
VRNIALRLFIKQKVTFQHTTNLLGLVAKLQHLLLQNLLFCVGVNPARCSPTENIDLHMSAKASLNNPSYQWSSGG